MCKIDMKNNKMTRNNQIHGFTLPEILVAVALAVTIMLLAINLLNPKGQLSKIHDVNRKRDLNQLTRIFEEYYSDKESYPRQSDVCIDLPTSRNGICSCHLCGLSSESSKLKSYASKLFCDPSYPQKKYLYQYDCTDTPQWYSVCASLDNQEIQNSLSIYNYGVASTNRSIESCLAYDLESPTVSIPLPTSNPTSTPILIASPTSSPIPTRQPSITLYISPTPWPTGIPMPTCQPDPVSKWCIKSGCNNCGTFAQCQSATEDRCDQPVLHLYTGSCAQECRF